MNNRKTYEKVLTHTPFLKEICKPLFNTFNLTTFGYKRVIADGRYIFLSTSEDWLKFHYENIGGHGLFFKDAMDRSKELGYERTVWPKEPKDDFLQSLFVHNMHNGINFYRKDGECIDLWTFSTNTEQHQDPNSYINILNHLEKFIIYFNGIASNVLQKYKESDYAKLQGKIGIEQQVRLHNDDQFKLSNFYKFVDKPCLVIQGKEGPVTLTKRQQECLEKLCCGMTAKEISRNLDISARTVEEHIEAIKKKGGFYTRSDLVQQFYKASLVKKF